MTTITTGLDGQTRFDGMTTDEMIASMEKEASILESSHVDGAPYIRSIIAAIRHLSAELEGEPMDTAPRDGTVIRVRCENGAEAFASYCRDGYWRFDMHDDYECKPERWWKPSSQSKRGTP